MTVIPIRRVTGADVADVVASADFAVLPVGAIEWHGPHLPLGTDTILADGFADALDGGDWTAVRYPTVSLTAVPGQTRHYPGTVAVRPDTMVDYLSQVLLGIARNGFRRVLVLNAHDANMSTARAAMEWVSGELPVSILLANWFQLVPWTETAEILGPGPARGHGGAFETAGVLAFDPETVRLDGVDDLPPRPRLQTADHVLVESHPAPWQGWSGRLSMVTQDGADEIRRRAERQLHALVAEWLARPEPESPTTGVPGPHELERPATRGRRENG
ncbi:creatininase family protein [Stackebrandtia soli]|uniref:creatininase family protein n=1 Tax=Stackebrandtia soli TaxID=1892856 RepID=UPI0039E86982